MKVGTCIVEGCGTTGQMRKGMCNKHYRQWFDLGYVRERTKADPNEIIILKDYAVICIYGENDQVINCAKIDIEDVERVSGYIWSMNNENYVTCFKLAQSLHNFVMNNDGTKLYDHRNINPLDNRKCNLRECSKYENAQNRRTRRDTTTGAKGVCCTVGGLRWVNVLGTKASLYLRSGWKFHRGSKVLRASGRINFTKQ